MIASVLQDLRYAVRTLAQNRGFAAICVIVLALGIGANTAIFTVVDAALLRGLPYTQPDQLVHLWEFNKGRESDPHEASYPDYVKWKEAGVFSGAAGYTVWQDGVTLTGEREPEQVVGAGVTANFFDVLGVQASLGRTFSVDEDRPGTSRVVVLGDSIWRRRFGADRGIIGKTLVVNQRVSTIVGVLPAGFQFAKAGAAQVWIPVVPSANQAARSYWHWLNVIARLRAGVSIDQAQSAMHGVARNIATSDPKFHTGTGIKVETLRDSIIGPVRPLLLVLLGTVAFVLFIACANVASLLLARSAARQKEIAVRASLGAGRWRLTRQLLTESLMLAVAGGAFGLLLAMWGVRALAAAIPENVRAFMPYLEGLGIDGKMFAFTAAITLLTGVAFGVAPALQLSRNGRHDLLKSGARTSVGRGHQRLRSLLVVSEVAVALVLLAGAGLMMKSTLRLLQVNPGFNPDRLLTMQISLPASKYNKYGPVVAFHRQLIERLESLPGVKGAGTVSVLPLNGGGNSGTFEVIGRPVAPDERSQDANVRTISTGYFHTMGIPLIKGRLFTERDDLRAQKVVLVNQTLVRTVFGKEDPIGKRIGFVWSPGPWEIAGVVGDENVVSLDVKARPVVYFPYLQGPDSNMNVVVRAAASPAGLSNSVRNEVRALDAQVPVYGIQTMDQLIGDSPTTFMRRYPAFLIGSFAAIALLLAVAGTYGLVAYSVTQRVQEIGIRMALGAQRADILRLVVKQVMALILAGVAIGVGGALPLVHVLRSLLFGVEPGDPATFVGVSALLAAAALVACYVPARRATRVDPMVVLRY
jgi:putative ABC transport system permease protein